MRKKILLFILFFASCTQRIILEENSVKISFASSEQTIRSGEEIILQSTVENLPSTNYKYQWTIDDEIVEENNVDYLHFSSIEIIYKIYNITVSIITDTYEVSTSTIINVLSQEAATLSVTPSLAILKVGESLSFTVESSKDLNSFSYKWYVDDVEQVDKTDSSFILDSSGLLLSDGDELVVTVNAIDNDTQDIIVAESFVTIQEDISDAILIKINNVSESIIEQTDILFTTDSVGDNLTYKWFVNGSLISGETDSSYLFTASSNLIGNCVIKVECSDATNTTSDSISFNILANSAPIVSIEGGDRIVSIDDLESSSNITFVANATDINGDDLTYKWYLNDSIRSSSSSEYIFYNVPIEIASYNIKVEVSDGLTTTEVNIIFSVKDVMIETPESVTFIENSGTFDYEVDFGTSLKDVYFIFSNPTDSDSSSTLNVSGVSSVLSSSSYSYDSVDNSAINSIKKFNSRTIESSSLTTEKRAISNSSYSVGSQRVFYEAIASSGSTVSTVSSTLAKQVSDIVVADGSTVSLEIYVANNDWNSLITQEMVDVLADKFLKDGLDNDIYDWETTLYGKEWGSRDTSDYFIDENNRIVILLHDILSDRSVSGGVLGLFYSRDNYNTDSLHEILKYSNEEVMFYIDSYLYAEKENSTWDSSDYWPNTIISTLAHEFMHAIMFYQKNILNNISSVPTWFSEMHSVVCEDFLSTKIFTDGPRNVSYLDGSSGSPNNNSGRLSSYILYNDSSFTEWSGDNSTGGEQDADYGLVYSLGAYLVRNFGGPELFSLMVNNSEVGKDSIVVALTELGYDITFNEVLKYWGASSVLSSDDPKFAYNTGDYFVFDYNNVNYKLGSIDMANYSYGGQSGMKYYSSLKNVSVENNSNKFMSAGSYSGTKNWTITLPANVEMTMVVK